MKLSSLFALVPLLACVLSSPIPAEAQTDADQGYEFIVRFTDKPKETETAPQEIQKRDVASVEQVDADQAYEFIVRFTDTPAKKTTEKRDPAVAAPYVLTISFGADGIPIVSTAQKRHEESDASYAIWTPFTNE